MMLAVGEPSPLMLAWTMLQFGFNVVLGLWMAALQARSRKIESLESMLKASNEQQIAVKFESVEAKLKVPISTLNTLVEQIESRLRRGDEDFDRLTDQWQKVELKLVATASQMKDAINEALRSCATRQDVETLSRRIDAMQGRSKA